MLIKTCWKVKHIDSIWIIVFAVILVQIAAPSLLSLYMLDESIDAVVTINVLGHQ